MCWSGATCLTVDCCFSDLVLLQILQIERVGLLQCRHHHFINACSIACSFHEIAENSSLDVKQ
jgi:hypothetical protein